ncbi:hypothetical protein [Streptomyces sp. F-1]|uniref:hypothetical protein n=1 Tax=Streptomyces sp. F-1 TaxID=463642 RepID=UPI000AB092F5|nr:hypothetical protein [Streptomyces sp. F-1]
MNLNRTTGRWSAATVLPVALLAATVAASGTTASAAPAPGKAVFVLDADTGSFATGKTALASSGVHTVKTYTGEATDSEILAAGSQRVIADVTLAHSASRTERAAWAASAKFVDLSWPDLGATSYTVIRDGKVIARTSGHSLRDDAIVPGSEPSYQISGDAKGLGHTWGLNVTVPTSDTSAALAQTARKVEAKAKKYTKTVVTWRSFIRQPWVTVPTYISKASGCKYGGGSYKYKGDGRGYSNAVSGTSFRAGVRGVFLRPLPRDRLDEGLQEREAGREAEGVDQEDRLPDQDPVRRQDALRARSDRGHRSLLPQVRHTTGRHRRVLRRPPRPQR